MLTSPAVHAKKDAAITKGWEARWLATLGREFGRGWSERCLEIP